MKPRSGLLIAFEHEIFALIAISHLQITSVQSLFRSPTGKQFDSSTALLQFANLFLQGLHLDFQGHLDLMGDNGNASHMVQRHMIPKLGTAR